MNIEHNSIRTVEKCRERERNIGLEIGEIMFS